jgi:phage terminase small subunit
MSQPGKKLSAPSRDALLKRSLAECNDRERKFVEQYHLTQDARTALERAGYSTKRHSTVAAQIRRLLQRPRVREALDILNDRQMERLDIDADWVVQETISVYFEARYNGRVRDALRALEMLGKHTKAFVETVEHLNLPQASEEELQDRVATLLSKLAEKGITLDASGAARTIEHTGRDAPANGAQAD